MARINFLAVGNVYIYTKPGQQGKKRHSVGQSSRRNPAEIIDIFVVSLARIRCKLSKGDPISRPLTTDACGARRLLNVSRPSPPALLKGTLF